MLAPMLKTGLVADCHRPKSCDRNPLRSPSNLPIAAPPSPVTLTAIFSFAYSRYATPPMNGYSEICGLNDRKGEVGVTGLPILAFPYNPRMSPIMPSFGFRKYVPVMKKVTSLFFCNAEPD